MVQVKNQTEEKILSITKNCATLNKQTHKKPQKTMDFKFTQPTEIFSFEPAISIERCWKVGLTSLELYNSIFIKTEENNKIELFPDNFDEFSFTSLKDELEEMLGLPDITPKHLQYNVVGPRFFQDYKKLGSEKSSTDGYLIKLIGYA